MEIQVSNNLKQSQFEVLEEGEIAVLQYRIHEGVIWLMHTEVPKNLEGRGIAAALAHFSLEWAKENHIKAKVLCPFVAVYLKRHPEYNEYIVK
ncbi:MAG TPA: GNAT family N-acetyltransferase [Puia sp.]|nr:GNAT family N-acetyltransferase [Puia sp.]